MSAAKKRSKRCEESEDEYEGVALEGGLDRGYSGDGDCSSDVDFDADRDYEQRSDYDDGDDDDDVAFTAAGGRPATDNATSSSSYSLSSSSSSDWIRRKRGGGKVRGGGGVGSSGRPAGHIDTPMLDCSRSLTLKDDHMKKPCWVYLNNLVHPSENIIVLEASLSCPSDYEETYDFLVSIADPVARPKYVHRYKLTADSLYAAATLGQTKDDIITKLESICKTNLPPEMIAYIERNTESFGKAKFVLKDNEYRIEAIGAAGEQALNQLLDFQDAISKSFPIRDALIVNRPHLPSSSNSSFNSNAANSNGSGNNQMESSSNSYARFDVNYAPVIGIRNNNFCTAATTAATAMDEYDDYDDNDDEIGSKITGTCTSTSILKTYSVMIRDDMVQLVKQCANKVYPLLEEYDYSGDTRNPTLNIDLTAAARRTLRPYQQKALMKMFGNGRARSGLIVLPCGAGKTLTGIAALATIRKSAVILCPNSVSLQQWKDQIKRWTSIDDKYIKVFEKQIKEPLLLPSNEACIVLTTYTMFSHTARSAESQAIVDQMVKREWGLLLLDEVHMAPAEKFQKVVSLVKAHTKLGLTATLVREDDKIQNLQYLVGPKLYEANWINLTDQGYLARVECHEVWCPMTPDFFREYISTTDARYQRLLYGLNPRKLRTCAYLVDRHIKRHDKILIFSDDIIVLKRYCEELSCDWVDGKTHKERSKELFKSFSEDSQRNVLGLSRVGDVALNLPEASVIIQVSSQFGSNRQEAQRLGRILRPKPGSSSLSSSSSASSSSSSSSSSSYSASSSSSACGSGSGSVSGGTATFYSLVSKNTKDMYFSSKRQKYLLDQGYTYHINKQISEAAEDICNGVSICRSKVKEDKLLSDCMNADRSVDRAEDLAILKEMNGDNNYENDDE